MPLINHEAASLEAPRRKARVEIIPLIDVVFFLLATFVLFTLALEKITVLEPQKPVPGEPPHGDDQTAYIQATEQGMFFWKQGRSSTPELISAVEIPSHLEHYSQAVPVPRVFIGGENKAKFGLTVMLIDEARKAHITQISMETGTTSSVF